MSSAPIPNEMRHKSCRIPDGTGLVWQNRGRYRLVETLRFSMTWRTSGSAIRSLHSPWAAVNPIYLFSIRMRWLRILYVFKAPFNYASFFPSRGSPSFTVRYWWSDMLFSERRRQSWRRALQPFRRCLSVLRSRLDVLVKRFMHAASGFKR